MPQSNNEYHLNRYHERMKAGRDLLGGKCVQCGSTENLEFDHIDPATKSFGLADGWGRADFFEELKKCQLLCHDCHKQKSDEEQTTRQHGTYAMYRRGKCRCEMCSEAGRAYMRAWHERHK
jgi:5-methylcytosine-specific restriction endonuclease McrA